MSDQKLPLSPSGQPQPGQPAHPPQIRPIGPGLSKPAGSAVPNVKVPTHDTSAVDLIDEAETHVGTKIRAYGVADPLARQTQFKRPTNVTKTGAVRIRTFHGRLSDEGLAYMDEKINQWLDEHPEIEIKLVTTAVGPYEGKIKEPALIVNVWY